MFFSSIIFFFFSTIISRSSHHDHQWKEIMWNNEFAMIETIIDKWKIIERKTKKNIKKITKRNNSALNFKQAEWTKKSTDENEIKFYKINKITIESTFSVTNTARAERKRWHSIIYESIYLYLISSLIRFVTSSSLISVSSHYNV